MIAQDDAVCVECGIAAPDKGQFPRVPCLACGSTGRRFEVTVHETITARMGLSAKAKHDGARGEHKWFFETQRLWSFFFKTKEWHHVSRTVDRENDRYIEHIVDEAGKVIRSINEPLSSHWNRGDAKPKARV